jgi:hypothetical protein
MFYISEEVMAMDTNNDGSINLGDEVDADHLAIMVEYCD